EWIERVTDDELRRIPQGPDLVAGPVLRDPDGQIWVVYLGSRRLIAGSDAYRPLNISLDDARPATRAELDAYPIGRPVGNPIRPWTAGVVLLVAILTAGGWGWAAYPRSGGRGWPAALGGGDAPGGRRRLLLGAGWLILGTSLLKLYFVSLFPWIPDGSDADAYVSVARYLATGGSILRDDPAGGLISVTSPLYTMVLA